MVYCVYRLKLVSGGGSLWAGAIERVELTFTQGRRVYSSLIAATIIGVDTPGS